MAKFPMDLSKFKKAHEDEHIVTLKHPGGHEFKIAKKGLSPKMKGMLGELSLPEKLADGGVTQAPKPSPSPTPEYSGLEKNADLEKAKKIKDAFVNYAEGGEAQPKPSPSPSPESPPELPKDTAQKFTESFNEPGWAEAKRNVIKFFKEHHADGGKVGEQLDAMLKEHYDDKQKNPKLEESKKLPKYVDGGEVTSTAEKDKNPALEVPVFDPALQTPQVVTNPENIDYSAIEKKQESTDAAAPTSSATSEEPPKTASKSLPEQAQIVSDPFGTEAYGRVYGEGLKSQLGGIESEAGAQSALGQAQTKVLNQQVAAQQENQARFQHHFDELDNERQQFVNDIQNQHIDPNHYLGSMNTGQTIATALGLIMGGLGSGITGQPNAALQFLNNQIDRDIETQKAQLGQKETLLSANLRQFGNMRDASDMTRLMMNDMAATKLNLAAAQTTDKMAQARAQMASGQLLIGAAPQMSQIAMRRAVASGLTQGRIDPAQSIRLQGMMGYINPEQQTQAFKELKEAETSVAARDRILKGFDQISKMQTILGQLNPQNKMKINNIISATVPGLSKETAGRFTEQDAAYIEHLMKQSAFSSAETKAQARQQLLQLMNEKMKFPQLEGLPIPVRMGASATPGRVISERPIK